MEKDFLCAEAPGKINLFLKVTGKHPDNYHTLESLFLPLPAVADNIAIDCDALPGAITVGCSDITLPGGTGNIAGKAAELWAKKAAFVPHWDINIAKNIPVAAGMGGGSSDAATVLKLLNNNYSNPLSDKELSEAALELGADVPYFLDPKPAIMTGIGEIAEPLDFAVPDLHILVLAPQFPVSAAEGYKLMLPEKISPMCANLRLDILNALKNNDPEKLGKLIFNDLQDGVFNKYPVLEMLSDEIKAHGALSVLMTGSGPTLFALFADCKTMKTAEQSLQAAHSECKVFTA
ncbi:MAG: 4-(cytidine 5'-diphospho)-2-C-methyl-D-erythritol kinase [Lentisphaeria bacterium]|nr:4-(cytidine 5'-diphospho)-2-C-methyl-D-erythritol kinase [Lentisphaeria bacterium]